MVYKWTQISKGVTKNPKQTYHQTDEGEENEIHPGDDVHAGARMIFVPDSILFAVMREIVLQHACRLREKKIWTVLFQIFLQMAKFLLKNRGIFVFFKWKKLTKHS